MPLMKRSVHVAEEDIFEATGSWPPTRHQSLPQVVVESMRAKELGALCDPCEVVCIEVNQNAQDQIVVLKDHSRNLTGSQCFGSTWANWRSLRRF